ncbi:hypothetical protein BLNAU_8533 [Blattamonas nauphoetae]|uniref:Uncharacterized protein n=1 Tax=Blattamonas nauphoetae TaxID=2049346 RepID=A0ABQ9XYF1_9EUKA|nr:hypothetical protein BLNAU_8533 [Blattamonas nauphoetae]
MESDDEKKDSKTVVIPKEVKSPEPSQNKIEQEHTVALVVTLTDQTMAESIGEENKESTKQVEKKEEPKVQDNEILCENNGREEFIIDTRIQHFPPHDNAPTKSTSLNTASSTGHPGLNLCSGLFELGVFLLVHGLDDHTCENRKGGESKILGRSLRSEQGVTVNEKQTRKGMRGRTNIDALLMRLDIGLDIATSTGHSLTGQEAWKGLAKEGEHRATRCCSCQGSEVVVNCNLNCRLERMMQSTTSTTSRHMSETSSFRSTSIPAGHLSATGLTRSASESAHRRNKLRGMRDFAKSGVVLPVGPPIHESARTLSIERVTVQRGAHTRQQRQSRAQIVRVVAVSITRSSLPRQHPPTVFLGATSVGSLINRGWEMELIIPKEHLIQSQSSTQGDFHKKPSNDPTLGALNDIHPQTDDSQPEQENEGSDTRSVGSNELSTHEDTLSGFVGRLMKELEEVENEKNALSTRIDELYEKNVVLSNEIEKIENQNSILKIEAHSANLLKEQVQQHQTEIEALQSELSLTKKKNRQLAADLDRSRSGAEALELSRSTGTEIRKLQKENAQLRIAVDDLVSKMKRNESELPSIEIPSPLPMGTLEAPELVHILPNRTTVLTFDAVEFTSDSGKSFDPSELLAKIKTLEQTIAQNKKVEDDLRQYNQILEQTQIENQKKIEQFQQEAKPPSPKPTNTNELKQLQQKLSTTERQLNAMKIEKRSLEEEVKRLEADLKAARTTKASAWSGLSHPKPAKEPRTSGGMGGGFGGGLGGGLGKMQRTPPQSPTQVSSSVFSNDDRGGNDKKDVPDELSPRSKTEKSNTTAIQPTQTQNQLSAISPQLTDIASLIPPPDEPSLLNQPNMHASAYETAELSVQLIRLSQELHTAKRELKLALNSAETVAKELREADAENMRVREEMGLLIEEQKRLRERLSEASQNEKLAEEQAMSWKRAAMRAEEEGERKEDSLSRVVRERKETEMEAEGMRATIAELRHQLNQIQYSSRSAENTSKARSSSVPPYIPDQYNDSYDQAPDPLSTSIRYVSDNNPPAAPPQIHRRGAPTQSQPAPFSMDDTPTSSRHCEIELDPSLTPKQQLTKALMMKQQANLTLGNLPEFNKAKGAQKAKIKENEEKLEVAERTIQMLRQMGVS